MKIAVVQHALRPAPAQDLEALIAAAVRARADGATVIVLPAVSALHEGPLNDELWRRLEDDVPDVTVVVAYVEPGDSCAVIDDPGTSGVAVVLSADACFSGETLMAALSHRPGIAILAPGSESELQAEATLEFAIALSTSLASLVVVVDVDGAEPGEPGHGGTAIVHLGEVLAEAMAGDELILADITHPVGAPEAPEPLPAIPPLLLQRVAAHEGRKIEVDYPADLS